MQRVSRVVFNSQGYDPFIDFLKAWCILVVVFCHGFPYLKEVGYAIWGVQIPVFFLIQVFHSYKRNPKPINWTVILRRIVIPFLVIQVLIFGVKFIDLGRVEFKPFLTSALVGGGYGPGSYYPWIYVQMALLIPLMRPVCDRLGKWKSLLLFVLLCESIEIICSITNLPDSAYRLLCLRYIMLIWFGWMWVHEGIVMNIKMIVASIISLCIIIYLEYFGGDHEPWLYDTVWATHRWICYFWVSWLFVWMLHGVYRWLSCKAFVERSVRVLAAASYEVFLIQMAYYAIIPFCRLAFITNVVMHYVIWFMLAFVVSIAGGVGLYRLEKFFMDKKTSV